MNISEWLARVTHSVPRGAQRYVLLRLVDRCRGGYSMLENSLYVELMQHTGHSPAEVRAILEEAESRGLVRIWTQHKNTDDLLIELVV